MGGRVGSGQNPGFRRLRNKALEPWKQTDKRTYEVRMSEKTKKTEGGAVAGRHTHPLPDNPVWKRAPVPSRNGVITSRSKPVVVDARLRVVDISNIDTVHGTATICVQVYLFWTDPRMIGYDHQVLPDKLWGPRLELQNVVDGQVEETQLAFQRMETGRFFSHHDAVCKAARDFKCKYPRPDLPGSENLPWPESGRMSRIIEYTATVKKTMSSFADFPFDLDRIDLSWVTSSSFETLDRSERGQRISRTAWKLRWIQKFGSSGQISQLKAFYQAKYQAEKIKRHPKVKDFMSAKTATWSRDGEMPKDVLEFAEQLDDVNGKTRGDVDIGKLPPLNKAHNKAILNWTETQIYRERIGRVARALNMLGDANDIVDQDGDGIDDEEALEGKDDASAWTDGKIVARATDGELDEWRCLGLSFQIVEHPRLPNAPQRQEMNLFIHIERKYGFYVFKVLLPLYLLLLITFCNAGHPTDDIGSRLSFTITGFLAAFAMLYIVGESLPKAEKLTSIDMVITQTTVTICLLGLSSVLVYGVHLKECPEEPRQIFTIQTEGDQLMNITGPPIEHNCPVAKTVDIWITAILAVLNLYGNVHIFWSPVSNRYRDKAKLNAEAENFGETTAKKVLTTAERVARDMHAMEQKALQGQKSETETLLSEENPMSEEGSISSIGSDSEQSAASDSDVESQDQDKRRLSKRIRQTKKNLKCLEMLLEQDINDTPLPTVNRFCRYVPWEFVETYSDYLRRRIPQESRINSGIKSEVRWAKFNQRRIDRKQHGTRAEKERLREDLRKLMADRIALLKKNVKKEEQQLKRFQQ